jgi:hypothetical protein
LFSIFHRNFGLKKISFCLNLTLKMKAYLLATIVALCLQFNAFGIDYYSVKFPNDTTVYGCGAAIPSSYPTITMLGNCNFNVGVSVNDQVFYTDGSQTCGKVLRRFRLIYWCDYNANGNPFFIPNPYNSNLGPTVIGNSINRGYLEYTQMIQFLDNVPPVFINCPTSPVVFCDYTNNNPSQYNNNYIDRCEGPVTLTAKVTDICSKANVNISYRLYLDLDGNGTMETIKNSIDTTSWPIEKTIVNDSLMARIKFPTNFGLPYGTHKVEWIAKDNCGNVSICKYEFKVKDCKAPTVVCLNGLSINIMQSGMITLWASDFLLYTTDNCTPSSQIKIGIRKAGTGSGFPLNSPSVTFNCTELGNQNVELWAEDAYGNADFCQTFVKIQDNWGICPPVTPTPNLRTFSGNIANDRHQTIPNVWLRLQSVDSTITNKWVAKTDSLGKYTFTDVPNCDITWSIVGDSVKNHHGISTMDVLLAANEIAGAYTPSPYRIIGTDVNRDSILDNKDLIKIIEMVLHPTQSGEAGWRFVPRNVVFADSTKPLLSPIPSQISLHCNDTLPANLDFVAIALGDLDGSATHSQVLQNNQDRDEPITRFFTTKKQYFKAGDWVTVPITTPDLDGLAGFQFTLSFDISALELTNVTEGMIPTDWLGIHLNTGKIAASWHSTFDAIPANKGLFTTAFTLIFKALQDGALEQSLSLNDDMVQSEAYSDILEKQSVELLFKSNKSIERSQNELEFPVFEAVKPNPNSGISTLSFFLPKEGEIAFKLTDISGRILQNDRQFFSVGNHEYRINSNVKGMLILQIESQNGIETKRIMVK